MIDQIMEWINYRPSDHFSEWILLTPVVVAIVLWLITTTLLITRWRSAWKTKTCKNALEDCHYVVTLLPWGVFMIPLAVVFTLFASEPNSGVEDLLLRILIVAFAVSQTFLLWRYAKGDHKHE